MALFNTLSKVDDATESTHLEVLNPKSVQQGQSQAVYKECSAKGCDKKVLCGIGCTEPLCDKHYREWDNIKNRIAPRQRSEPLL